MDRVSDNGRAQVADIIQTKNLTKVFGKNKALDNLTLNIKDAQNYGLLGPNGAGKTTLIRILAGILKPTSGSAIVMDERVPSHTVTPQIGYMTQSQALYYELTVRENISFFAKIYGLQDKRIREKRIDELIELVDLKDREHSRAETLSGGMRQRVSLATALVHKPRLLLLDEPTVGIDPELRHSFWNYFNDLNRQGVTIIISSHNMDEAEKCHRLGLLRDGKLLAEGSADDLKREAGVTEGSLEDAFLYFEEGKCH
jgi:ABC-2 type transport system ATP-binding protein